MVAESQPNTNIDAGVEQNNNLSDPTMNLSAIPTAQASVQTQSYLASFASDSITKRINPASIPALISENSQNQSVSINFSKESLLMSSDELQDVQSAVISLAPFYKYLQADEVRLKKVEPGTIVGGQSYYAITGNDLMEHGSFWLASLNFTSVYNTDKTHLYDLLAENGKEDISPEASLTHELVHLMRYQQKDGTYVNSSLMVAYENIFYRGESIDEGQFVQYDVSLLNEAPPTEYAQEYAHVSGASEESLRRAANEDLADSMALYVWAPEILKERAPLRYAFLDYVAKGGDPITFSFVNKVGEVVQIKQEFQFLIQSSIAPIGFIFGTLFKLVDAFGVMLYRAQLFAGLINRYRMKNSQQAIKKLASQQKVIQRNLEAVLSRYKYQQQTWNTRVALSPKQFGNSIEYVRYWYQALKSLDKVIIQQYRLKQFHEISPSNVNKIQPAQLIKQYWQKKGHDWQLRVGQIAESNRRYQQGLVSGALGANAVEPDSLFDQAIGFWSKALLDALKGSIRYIFSQNTSQEVKRMPAPETILQNPFLKWATPFLQGLD